MTVLTTLRETFAARDVEIFRVLKQSGTNIMTICPFHNQGRERKPSFGISTQSEMKCHCFTCGWVGTLDTLISELFGFDDSGAYGKQWLTKTFITLAVEDRKDLDMSRLSRSKETKTGEYVTEQELDSYRYIHPYMYKRGLTDEIIADFDVGYDRHTECLTFPVLDLNQNCVFIGRRSVRYKFFNYPPGVEKPVYGAYKFVHGDYEYAVVVESILNALTCWKYGIPAVALLGTGTAEQYRILKQLPVRKYILAFDPDIAGYRAMQRFVQALGKYKILTRYEIPRGYDLNDLQEQILMLKEYFI